jgi:pimeloyl-ACP methyl ester carboxylesterase
MRKRDSQMVTKQESANEKKSPRGGFAQVNGINLYYETHGAGSATPLVLLHGGLGQAATLGPILPALAEGRQVIAVDLQAHGRTADIDRTLSFESSADDVAALIRHLGYERADVMGYSFGGGTALQCAIRHPKLVRKLVLVSTPFKRNGWYPEVLVGMAAVNAGAAEMMKQGPIYPAYTAVAPRPEDWPVLLQKMGELLGRDYDWSQGVQAISVPVMIVFADADAIRPEHIVEFFQLLGGGQRDAGWDGSARPLNRLAVLPGQTHYDVTESPALAPAVASFLTER